MKLIILKNNLCFSVLCKGVKNSTSVSSLNFTGCGLSWKGAETLAKVIKVCEQTCIIIGDKVQ